MVTGILGKKLGMTQMFDETGRKFPVTIVEAGPCVVQAVKNMKKDGYYAVQLGFDDVREKLLNKPQREYLKSKSLPSKRFVKEIRCEEEPAEKVGDVITVNTFQKGDYLDVVGTSKGKGFQGGMKRWGWSGGKQSHGSMSHRVPGSIGASSYPSRVFKGQSGPGQMGNERVTTQNVKVLEVDTENDTVVLKGAVPGANGGYLIVRFARKKAIAERIVPEPVEPEVAEGSDVKEGKE